MQPLLGAFIFLVSFLLYEIFIIQKKNYNRFKSIFIGSVLKLIYLLIKMLTEHDSKAEN